MLTVINYTTFFHLKATFEIEKMGSCKYHTNPWVHTFYITAILLTIMIFIIVIMSKETISESAMTNVSFAATIVSIVLAVISIVISVVASFKTYQNLGGIQDVQESLSTTAAQLELLKNRVSSTDKKLESLFEKVKPLTTEQILRKARKEIEEHNEIQPSEKEGDKKAVYTPTDLRVLETKAIEKVTKDLHLTDVMPNVELREYPKFEADAIAKYGVKDCIIEVKLFRPSTLRPTLERLNVIENYMKSDTSQQVMTILILLLPDTSDLEKVKAQISPKIESYGIKPVFYTFNQLQ